MDIELFQQLGFDLEFVRLNFTLLTTHHLMKFKIRNLPLRSFLENSKFLEQLCLFVLHRVYVRSNEVSQNKTGY